MKKDMLQLLAMILALLLVQTAIRPGNIHDLIYTPPPPQDPPFLKADSGWVNSLMEEMSLEEKIAQMIMMPVYPRQGETHAVGVERMIKKHGIGGLIFFKGSPVEMARWNNRFQEAAGVPLLMAVDGEWGLSLRVDSVLDYPRQMTLGAINGETLIYRLGYEMAEQMKTMGFHLNFAPVADINNNPENPVINYRSFGENRFNVTRKVIAMFQGMQDNGLLVTAKHFPGHGDTHVDSHEALPVIDHDRQRLDSLELYPFRESAGRGLTGIMVAHLNVPALDDRVNRPATLSFPIVHDLLRDEMGFEGLVVTDALGMRGVSDYFEPGALEVEAVRAGNDILLMPSDAGRAIRAIKQAVRNGEIASERIDASCRRILLAKKWAGLDSLQPLETKNLTERLNHRKYLPLKRMTIEHAVTLVRDRDSVVPVSGLESVELATLNIEADSVSPFAAMVDRYKDADHYYLDPRKDISDPGWWNKQLIRYDVVMLNICNTSFYRKNYGIHPLTVDFLRNLDIPGKLIVSMFGSPYALDELDSLQKADAIIVGYDDDPMYQESVVQGIFGGIPFRGKLPVMAGESFPAATGIASAPASRLSYGMPEMVGMNYDTLEVIDSLAMDAIRQKATPGCQVLVARHGKVVWHKAYGYHTYQNRRKVMTGDLYDLASITKISSTVPALMRLQDQGLFHLDDSLGAYFPEMDTSAKGDLLIRDVLSHQSGLAAWIPFYQETLEPLDTSQALFSNRLSDIYSYRIGPHAYANRNTVYKGGVYETSYSESHPLQVGKDLYLRSDYRDSIYTAILRSPLGEREYRYSDLGYYYLYRVVEHLTDTMFYPYMWFNFYGPLGAETLGFLPLNRFSSERIVPTEHDMLFRRQLVHGHVHDPGAAMLGGICGHAGLFSNANDLAKMMQMVLNYGSYGGDHFIDSATIAAYTRCADCSNGNRRGLGFDRPITEEDGEGPACDQASEISFGHSGFTGTIAWMDPRYDLLYIFLSNRIHPNQYNTRLIEMDVRTKIQEMLYRSILDPGH